MMMIPFSIIRSHYLKLFLISVEKHNCSKLIPDKYPVIRISKRGYCLISRVNILKHNVNIFITITLQRIAGIILIEGHDCVSTSTT